MTSLLNGTHSNDNCSGDSFVVTISTL